MKTKFISLLVLTLMECSNIFGQTTPDFPFIEVTGNAEQSIVPDEITIAIKIKERFKSKEKITIKQQEDSLKYYMLKEGLDLNDLTLSNANADFVSVNWTKKAVLTETNYLYKATDAIQVSKIFQIAEKFLLYDAYISKVNHSKLEEFKSENRIKAIKNAKEKANQMLAAIGFQTGKPWIVQETTPNTVQYMAMADKSISAVLSSSAGVYSNDFGTDYRYESPVRYEAPADPYSVISSRHNLTFTKIKIASSVYIKYEIK
jgi:uncharacterized protein